MSLFYVGCILGTDGGRVLLGHLHKGELQVTEVRRFALEPLVQKDSVQWNIGQLYQELLEGLRTVAAYEEPIQSVSCTSAAGDYLLFDRDAALITPAIHRSDAAEQALWSKVRSRIPWDLLYEETGIPEGEPNLFLQLGSEPGKRLKRAHYIMPVADAFNLLLGGEPRIEMSMASATGLYNPVLHQWSSRVLEALKVRPDFFPPVVMSGTVLGRLKDDLLKETGLEEGRVVASCSNELSATFAGLPVAENENWAFLHAGRSTVLGLQTTQPLINEITRELKFSNNLGYGSSVCFYKSSPGLSILDDCQQYWEERDRSIDYELLSHLAGSSTPFESLIDPADPRFAAPGDMPLKIQAFCKETNQTVPRKPGPVYRCVLESLALHYRKLLYEIQHLADSEIRRIYFQSTESNGLLKHFTANAVQLPVCVIPADAAGMGNIVVQAMALGHLRSVEEAHQALGTACKVETIMPHARIWEQAYDRFVSLASGFMQPA